MQRYFLNQAYQPITEISDDNFHHMIHVMRMKLGSKVVMVFNDQTSVLGEITAINEETVTVATIERLAESKELPVQVTIACAFPKGDKLDLVIQKGTELGAHSFVAFPSENSVVKWDAKKLTKRAMRLIKIAKEASEQSHRTMVPNIELLATKNELVNKFDNYEHIIVAYEESAKQGETKSLVAKLKAMNKQDNVLVIIGPEGGFSKAEIDNLISMGAVPCGLGPRILRAETAPLYILSSFSFFFELFSAE